MTEAGVFATREANAGALEAGGAEEGYHGRQEPGRGNGKRTAAHVYIAFYLIVLSSCFDDVITAAMTAPT